MNSFENVKFSVKLITQTDTETYFGNLGAQNLNSTTIQIIVNIKINYVNGYAIYKCIICHTNNIKSGRKAIFKIE